MTEEQSKRKLTAILSADVKGYSRLMADDEEATVGTINAYREVMTRLIKDHRGRVVDAKGDNVLAEFASVVDAVRCSVDIQRELKKRNADLSEHRKMEFRIGVNLGDVIEEKETIYGDGVNVAARLEGLADAGGLCISGTAFDQVRDKLNLGYEYLGEQSVKNIPRPIRAYKVLMEEEHAGKVIGEVRPKPKQLRWAAIGAVAILIIAAGIFAVWNFYLRPDVEPASVEKMAYPLPDKPSIAVLPFVNMSGDSEQENIADGFTENIIAALSTISEMFVIARNSSFTYKAKPVRVQKVSEDLGVRYVLEGSIQKSGERVRVTAQLVDAIKGHHLWSERYDRNMKELFALQDEITKQIVVALQVKLTHGEQARLWHTTTDDLKAWEYAVKGLSHFYKYSKEDNAKARELFKRALESDPKYAHAVTMLAWTHFIDARFGYSKSKAESFKRTVELARKAVTFDEKQPLVHALLGAVFLLQRQHDKAIAEGQKSTQLGPNDSEVYTLLAMTMRYSGRFNEAVELARKAIRLHPYCPVYYHLELSNSLSMNGRYEEALQVAKKSLRRAQEEKNRIMEMWSRSALARILTHLDREKQAREHVSRILEINPKFSIDFARSIAFYKDPAHLNKGLEALRKVGLPDKPPLPLPDKPSIAVLPFVNMSGDPEQEYFSDGMTEEIITALSKTPKLFVIARNSTFTYKNKPTKVQQVGRELGVKYVLEGSVRKAGDKVRVTAQLVDAQSGNHIWAERYDRELKDIFAIQDEVTKKIITALQVKLTEGEHARFYAKGTENLNAYVKVMEANWLFSQGTKDGVLKARQLAEEAIALDSNYAFAYKMLGSTHGMAIHVGLSKNPRKSLKRAIELFRKAIELDDSLAAAHYALGFWLIYVRQYDTAIAEGKRAFELQPNSADVIMGYATILSMVGKPEEAIPLYKEALRLNPKPPNTYIRFLGIAFRDSGQYEKAIVQAKKAIEQEPNDLVANVVLASSLSLAGHEEEARTAAKEILRINPKFSVARWQKRSPHKDRAVVKRYCDALRKAALPE